MGLACMLSELATPAADIPLQVFLCANKSEFLFLLCIFAFGILASWLLGFSAFWLLAFRLLGFLASWLLGFLAFWLLGYLLVYAAFGSILCIPSSSSAGGVLAFAAFRRFMRLLEALAFRILCFPSSSPGFLAFAPFHWCFGLGFLQSIASSSLFGIITSSNIMKGLPPPNPPATF